MYRTHLCRVSRGALVALLGFGVHCAGGGKDATYCNSAGPPCGLSVDFEGGRLDVGAYAIEIDTPAGLTLCDYEVHAPSRQTADEAEKADEALVACGENDTCDEPCTGPESVSLRTSGLTIAGDAEDITITVENLETGATTEATFTPSYTDHPKECAACVIAEASMPLPAQP